VRSRVTIGWAVALSEASGDPAFNLAEAPSHGTTNPSWLRELPLGYHLVQSASSKTCEDFNLAPLKEPIHHRSFSVEGVEHCPYEWRVVEGGGRITKSGFPDPLHTCSGLDQTPEHLRDKVELRGVLARLPGGSGSVSILCRNEPEHSLPGWASDFTGKLIKDGFD
jgi:hypothetical protein